MSSNFPMDPNKKEKTPQPFNGFMRSMNQFFQEKPVKNFLQQMDEFFARDGCQAHCRAPESLAPENGGRHDRAGRESEPPSGDRVG